MAEKNDETYYMVDGEPYYRVTHMIDTVHGGPKGGMSYWGAKLMADYIEAVTEGTEFETTAEDIYAELLASPFNPNTVKKEAGTRGDKAHGLFEGLILGELRAVQRGSMLWIESPTDFDYVPTSYELGAARAYLDIFAGIEGVLPEQKVVSHKHHYAGRSDVIRAPIIADLKTHKPNDKKEPWAPGYWTDFLQQAAYALARNEETGEEFNEYMVILPTDEGEYLTAHWFIEPEMFLHTVAMFNVLEGAKREQSAKG
jgi:hypothetical protein